MPRLLCSPCVQAFYRSRRSAQRHYAACRQAWDERLQKLPAATTPPADPASSLAVIALARELVFFYNPTKDVARLTALAPYLVQPPALAQLSDYHRQRLARLALELACRPGPTDGAVVALLSALVVDHDAAMAVWLLRHGAMDLLRSAATASRGQVRHRDRNLRSNNNIQTLTQHLSARPPVGGRPRRSRSRPRQRTYGDGCCHL